MWDEFEKRDTVVIAIAQEDRDLKSHGQFLSKFGSDRPFDIVADIGRKLTKKYDRVTTYLIDKEGIVRHQVVNDLPFGRNVDEVLRMVDALQFVEEHGEVCPANWMSGMPSMKPDQEGLEAYFANKILPAGAPV